MQGFWAAHSCHQLPDTSSLRLLSKVPQIAVDQDGLAEVVDPHAKIGDTAPADLAGLVADLYVTGGRYTP